LVGGHGVYFSCAFLCATHIYTVPDKTNKDSVRAIQKSIFTVCLDAPKPSVSDMMYHNKVAAQMLHGGGSRWNSGNRWFDKTLQVTICPQSSKSRYESRCIEIFFFTCTLFCFPQFIIGEDGSCGLTYEHAAAEGPPIVFLVDHVVDYM